METEPEKEPRRTAAPDALDPAQAVGAGEAEGGELQGPRLPQRAAIYIATDGTVIFGALFRDLVPVLESLRARGPGAG